MFRKRLGIIPTGGTNKRKGAIVKTSRISLKPKHEKPAKKVGIKLGKKKVIYKRRNAGQALPTKPSVLVVGRDGDGTRGRKTYAVKVNKYKIAKVRRGRIMCNTNDSRKSEKPLKEQRDQRSKSRPDEGNKRSSDVQSNPLRPGGGTAGDGK